MTDRIVLQGVSATGHHGVLDHEKRDGQTFVVDVVMDLDLAPAGRSDDLAHTVNYAEVAGDVVRHIEGEPLDLIEALAARIAEDTLRRPLVEAVEVTVHKPQAPVGHPFTDVQVVVRRERRVPAVVAMGSNLGDSRSTLEAAVRDLARVEGVRVTAVSPLVATDPVGGPEQPDYLNAIALVTTRLAPGTLLARLHDIEAAHGRVRETRWGARTLDLDLVQYGDPVDGTDTVSDDEHLLLPHPRAHERGFVLAPWHLADPAAYLRVEGEPTPVEQLLGQVDLGGVRPSEQWRPTW
ncbi:MAG: 2-amino-4-hydroxy-6-hydroxymethyldihydropteridine diphosphokinase [Micrococcales bacterium]|nr:2-amino-4-hydroxy-6-hydroxymethyldihydropteridine diphosphokinase [Micrococcales bacterium]